MKMWSSATVVAEFQSWERLPCLSLDELAPGGALLVIAPHPDDETLGCGGLIASALAAGRNVLVVMLTDGAASHPQSDQYSPMQIAELRAQELRRAARALGLPTPNLVSLNLADGRLMEESPDILAVRIQSAVGSESVGSIFAPAEDDPHPDHQMGARVAHRLAIHWAAICWSYPVRSHVIQAFLESPNDLVCFDVAKVLERKQAALKCHASQTGGLADASQGFCLTDEDIAQHMNGRELYRRHAA